MRIVIKDVDIFDAQARSIKRRCSVAFTASPGEIIEVSSPTGGDNNSAPDYAITEQIPDQIIDGAGCTILPALIDTNVDAGACHWSLNVFARFGIARIIDLSSATSDAELMRAFSATEPWMPSYLASGTAAATSRSEDTRLFPVHLPVVLDSPRGATAYVNNQVDGPAKVDYIKAIAEVTDAVSITIQGEREPESGPQILRTLVDAAHQRRKLAIAHAATTGGYRSATAAGFDVITHVPVDGLLDQDVARVIVAKGIVCIPTLCTMQKTVQIENARGFGAERADTSFHFALQAVSMLNEMGACICAGTGSNSVPDKSVDFGRSLHDELELLVQAGLSHEQAISAATYVPASALRFEQQRLPIATGGLLDPGSPADMILVEGNPMEDIKAIRRIQRAWIRGIEVQNLSNEE